MTSVHDRSEAPEETVKAALETTALVTVLGLLAATLLPAPVSGPWGSLLESAVVAMAIAGAAWWQASRRGEPRTNLRRLGAVAGCAVLLIIFFFALTPAPWLPLHLPGWFLLLAVLLCLSALGLAEQTPLRWLPVALLATPLAFLTAFGHVPPVQLPTLEISVPVAALHLVVDVLAVLVVLHCARRGASLALLLPALLAIGTSTANLYRTTLMNYPAILGDLSIHPSRDIIAHPDEVMELLGLEGGEDVADIRAGTGYYSFRMARAVGPEGWVVATDAEYGGPLGEAMQARVDDPDLNPHENVSLWTHQRYDCALPAQSFDLVLLSQVPALLVAPDRMPWVSRQQWIPWPMPFGARYHNEARLVQSLYDALRPGGRLVVINMLDDPDWPFRRSKLIFYYAHDEAEVVANYEASGFRLLERHDLYQDEAHQRAMERFQQEPEYETMALFFMGRRKFFMVFEKPEPETYPAPIPENSTRPGASSMREEGQRGQVQ